MGQSTLLHSLYRQCESDRLLVSHHEARSYDENKTKDVKFALEQAMKTQRGVDIYLYSFFNLTAS
jgi:hypothetical protein